MIKFLKSNNFAITIAILSVLVQSFHSFSVFYRLSSIQDTVWGIMQAVMFSLVIDLAILFYTVRKNVKVTWMAGFVMVLINVFYYYTHLGISFELIMGGLLSLVIPVSVYYYSEEIEDEIEVDATEHERLAKIKEVTIAFDNYRKAHPASVVNDGVVDALKVAKPGFANLKSPAHELPKDKSLLNIPRTDRPNKE